MCLSLEQKADTFAQNLGAKQPKGAEVDEGCEQDADQEEQKGRIFYPACGEIGDDHCGGGHKEEGEGVFEGGEEGVMDFPIEETVPDAYPQNDDDDVGENHQRDS